MLNGALIGCGNAGEAHLDAWRKVHSATIVAVADKDSEKAKELAGRAGVAAHYGSLFEVLDWN